MNNYFNEDGNNGWTWTERFNNIIAKYNRDRYQSRIVTKDLKDTSDECYILDTSVFFFDELVNVIRNMRKVHFLCVNNSLRELLVKYQDVDSLRNKRIVEQALFNYKNIVQMKNCDVLEAENTEEIVDVSILREVAKRNLNCHIRKTTVVSGDRGLIDATIKKRENNINQLGLVLNSKNQAKYTDQIQTIYCDQNDSRIRFFLNHHFVV